jgi:hypothetical protein
VSRAQMRRPLDAQRPRAPSVLDPAEFHDLGGGKPEHSDIESDGHRSRSASRRQPRDHAREFFVRGGLERGAAAAMRARKVKPGQSSDTLSQKSRPRQHRPTPFGVVVGMSGNAARVQSSPVLHPPTGNGGFHDSLRYR